MSTPFSRAPQPDDPGPMRKVIPGFGLATVLQHFWHPHSFEDGATEWADEFGEYSTAGARDLSVSGDDSLTREYDGDRPYVRLTTTAALAAGTDLTEAETGTLFCVARINTGDQIDTNGTIINNGRSSIQMNTEDSTTVNLTDGTPSATASLGEYHLFTLTTPSDTLRTRFTIDDVAIEATNLSAGASRSVKVGTTVPSKREMDVLAVWTTEALPAATITDEVWPRVKAWIEGEMLSAPAETTTYVTLADKGVADGVATLDGDALIPDAQIPPTIARDAEVAAAIAAAGDGWTYERLAANWTDATAALTDVFAGFAPAAGVEYEVEISAMIDTSASTTGFQPSMAGPASPQLFGFKSEVLTSASGVGTAAITAPGGVHATTSTVSNPSPFVLKGRCRWTAPGAGNVKLQARAEPTAGGTVTVYAKSYMRWRALP